MIDMPSIQSVDLPSGRTLAWREWGTGQPLILLHGWSMSSVVFGEIAQSLAKHFRVLCPDLPGHGDSDPLIECSLSGLAKAVVQWVAQLRIESADLLGWSLGGQVSLQIAAEAELVVNRLLLVATTPCFCQREDWKNGLPKTQVKALDRNLGRAYEKTMGDFFNLQFVDEALPRERYRQILAFAVRSGRLPHVELARETLQVLGQADLRPRLADIQQPTFILHGELDQIIPVGAGEFLVKHVSDASFYKMPSIGHAPFFSRPEECVEQWLEFLL